MSMVNTIGLEKQFDVPLKCCSPGHFLWACLPVLSASTEALAGSCERFRIVQSVHEVKVFFSNQVVPPSELVVVRTSFHMGQFVEHRLHDLLSGQKMPATTSQP